MKYSIRYIQSNYLNGIGTYIFILRGMEIRKYKYSAKRFFSIRQGVDFSKWESIIEDAYIGFSRKYKEIQT